jgi:hypothetical protein
MARTRLETATLIVCVFDAAAWIVVAVASVMSGSDPATRGLDHAAGLAVTALFLVTGVPAFALRMLGRAPVTALLLALAFPTAFAVGFVALVVAFA